MNKKSGILRDPVYPQRRLDKSLKTTKVEQKAERAGIAGQVDILDKN